MSSAKRPGNAEPDQIADRDAFHSLYETSPMAIAFVDPDGRFVRVNPMCEVLFGRSEEELQKLTTLDVTHPDDREGSRKILRDLAESRRASMIFEKRYLRADGSSVWASVSISTIRDREGRFVGATAVISDISGHRASLEQQALILSLLEATIDATNEGLLVVDISGKIAASNRRFAELWQMPEHLLASRDDEALLRHAMSQLVNPELFLSRVHSVYANRDAVTSDILEFKDGRVLARSSRPQKIGDRITGVVWSFRDITAQVRAENENAEAFRRSEILSEASRVLAESLDYETTIRTVGSVIVPKMGDWSAIGISGRDGGMTLVAFTSDPPAPEMTDRIRHTILDPAAPEGIPRVIRTGKAVLYPIVTEENLNSEGGRWPIVGTRDPKTLEGVRNLGLRSFMIVPLVVRGKVIGAMSIARARGDRRYGEDDLSLAEELGRRIAIALDSAMLYRDALRTIQVREDFLSVASHELRTPLSPLRMQLEMARLFAKSIPTDYSQRADLLEVIEGAGTQMDRLLKLVNNILDVSRITAGRLNLHCDSIDLAMTVRDTVKRFEPECTKVGCTINLALEENVTGYWDPIRMEQVILNLLSNAVKFGGGKPVEIRLATRSGEAHLSVIDRGSGIPPEDLERIFERFERSDAARKFQGFGLGLFICREIVGAHAGKISAENAPEGGMIFTVRLPIRTRSP